MRHQRPIALAAVALAAALAACRGDDGGSAPRTACSYGAYCNQFEGDSVEARSLDATCASRGGTAMRACPSTGVLGRCTRLRNGNTIVSSYYEPSLIEAVRGSCIALKDTWSTP